MLSSKRNLPTGITVSLALLQVLSGTCLLPIKNFAAFNSILFLVCGVGISVAVLFLPFSAFSVRLIWNRQLILKLVVVAAFLPLSYHFARQILDGTPLRIEYADMLPIIAVMCQRFLLGQFSQVYQPIPGIWGGIQPIYLPALWLPFSFSFLFHFDLRWTTVSCIWLAVILCLLPAWRRTGLLFPFIAALFVLLLWLHFNETNNVIRLTEEGIVFFYYAVMAAAIILYNPWLLGTVAALCLLSRYALIGWLPFALVYLLTSRQYRFAVKSVLAGFITSCLLVFPFGWRSFLFQLQLPGNYVQQGQRVWQENPEYFMNSLGMAKFFVPAHLQWLHYCLVTGTFLVPAIFLFVVHGKFKPVNILLAGFQLSITFFYNFLDVSYLYLYYTPVFVSLVIAGWALSKATMKTAIPGGSLHGKMLP